MYCKHCGAQIDDNSKFCSSCGQSLVETTQTAPTNNIPNEEDIKIQEEKKLEAIKNKKKKTKKIVKITPISLGVVLVVLVLVLAVVPFISCCNGNYNKTLPEAELEQMFNQANAFESSGNYNKTLPEAELEQMFNQAYAFEASANFDKAFELFEILYENKYPDKGFSSQGLDEAFEIRKGRYTRNAIVCRMYSYAVSSLKSALKDPNSLVIYKITMKVDSSNKYKIIITIDYGATNSFGAMVRDDYTYPYTLSSDDREAVYESLKDWMDERGATSEDSADYLAGGNHNIYQQSQYDAIVAGTASY